MKLNEVLDLGVRAINVRYQVFLDGPRSNRRYVEIVHFTDPLESLGEADEYIVRRHASPPEGFPDDYWLPLEE